MATPNENGTISMGRKAVSTMRRHRNLLWLLAVSALLVVILGPSESGRLTGLKSFGLGGGSVPIPGGFSSETNASSSTMFKATGILSISSSATRGVYLSPLGISLSFSYWYLYVLAALAMLSALGLILRGGREGGVWDFASDLEKLENERRRLESSWSFRARNAALVNYYLLMRKLGAQLGIREVPQETPREYLDRVSEELKVDPTQTHRFADAFNRARYGMELTEPEIQEASKFMGGFVDGIRSRMKLG